MKKLLLFLFSATALANISVFPPNGGGGGGGSGTVTSVGVQTDATSSSIFANSTNNITGSPVTTAGNMTLTFSAQSANACFAGPTSGSAAAPTFRTLVAADLPTGNLTDAGTDGITIGSGSGAVIGSGTTISQHVADTSHNGYLSFADWNTFNGKGSGSVTSVTFTGDGTVLSSTPSGAVTTTGTLTAALASHAQNLILASPNGSSGTPTFRAIVGADLPNITNSAVQVLSGYTAGAGTVSSTDTPLTAIQKLDGNIQALPAAPTVSTVATTDATVTTIYTMATSSDTSYTVTQNLIGRRTGGSGGSADDSFGDYAIWLVKNVGGTASVVQISQQGYADQGNENWTLTAAASTTNILFKVKGVANNNISWKLSSSSVSQ